MKHARSLRRRWGLALCALAVVGIALVSTMRTPPAPVSLRVIGFETNFGGFPGIYAIIQITNASVRSITFMTDGVMPFYDRLIQTTNGWEELDRGGYANGFRLNGSLQPGKVANMFAVIPSKEPFRIRMCYRFSCLPTCVERYVPSLLLRRLPRLRERTVTSPVIQSDRKLLLLARANDSFLGVSQRAMDSQIRSRPRF
jgi:hypothetical protein